MVKKKNNKHVTKKRVYDYTDFCIRKTIAVRGESVSINVPKIYAKLLGWTGKENIKIRVLGQKLIISQVK